MNYLILLSAGKGERLGFKESKALVRIGNKTLIEINIESLNKIQEIDHILIVSSKEDKPKIEQLIAGKSSKLIDSVILGGEKRQDSARNGLKFIEDRLDENDIVLFHNVANPFVTKEEISELISQCEKYSCCVLGRKSTSTIRKTDDESKTAIVDREKLYEMETPQAIKASLAIKAFGSAYEDNFYGTDDVSLVERLNEKVKIIQCSEFNFKITTKKDYYLANYLVNNNLI